MRSKITGPKMITLSGIVYFIFFRFCTIEQNHLDQISPRAAFNFTEPSNTKNQSIKTYKIVIFFMVLFLSLMVVSYFSKNRADHIQVNITEIFMHVSKKVYKIKSLIKIQVQESENFIRQILKIFWKFRPENHKIFNTKSSYQSRYH